MLLTTCLAACGTLYNGGPKLVVSWFPLRRAKNEMPSVGVRTRSARQRDYIRVDPFERDEAQVPA